MRILICDDEQKFVDELKFHIERYMQTHLINAEITTTVSPEEILKGDAVYDLAFLDIQMPGVDGITLSMYSTSATTSTLLLVLFKCSINSSLGDRSSVTLGRTTSL